MALGMRGEACGGKEGGRGRAEGRRNSREGEGRPVCPSALGSYEHSPLPASTLGFRSGKRREGGGEKVALHLCLRL